MSYRQNRNSYSTARSSRGERHVRFSLPLEPAGRRTQPTLSRTPTPRLREQATLTAPTSLPSAYLDRLHLAHESLHDIRSFLESACNFHGAEKRRALTVLSISSLSLLLSQVNRLTGERDANVTRRLEAVLERARVDPLARHPHEQLIAEPVAVSSHELNARRGARRRSRREAEWRLMEFVSRQLHIPTDVLRELPRTARAQRELEAFTQRLQRFNVARPPPRTAGGRAGTGSVPQSPVDRRYTEPRPPETDPAGYVRRAYGFDDGRLPEMGDLNLPAAVPSHVQGPGLAHAVHARLSAMQPVVGLPPGMGMQPVMSGLQPGYPQYQQQQPAAYMGVYGGVPTTGYQTAPAAYQGAPMGGYPGAAPAPPIQAAYMHPQQHGTATASMDTRGSYVTQPRY